MKVELRPTSSIRPYPGNPRDNDDAVAAVAQSIRQFGFRQPIVVNAEGVIVAGHTRWRAAQQLGLERVPVHVARDLPHDGGDHRHGREGRRVRMDDPTNDHRGLSEPARRVICHGVDRQQRENRIVVKLVDDASIESDTVIAHDVPEREMPAVGISNALKFVVATVGALPMAGDEEVANRSIACLGCEHFDLGLAAADSCGRRCGWRARIARWGDWERGETGSITALEVRIS